MKYDGYLRNALQHLFDHWMDPKTGLVAAALVDGDKVIYATSTLNPDGHWKHAERNALEKFEATHGQPPSKDAVMLVSLSPCTKRTNANNTSFGALKNDTFREGDSCSTLLEKYGVKNIGFGILDTMAVESAADYTERGFNVATISDQAVRATCKALNDMFPRYIELAAKGEKDCVAVKTEYLGSALCPKTIFENATRQSVARAAM